MSDKNFGSENYIKSTEILPEFEKKNNAFTIQWRIVLKKKCRKSTYQEAIQQHEPLRHQQLLEPRGHKQQEHNCEQDGEKPPGM
jgi:hypothetical protein